MTQETEGDAQWRVAVLVRDFIAMQTDVCDTNKYLFIREWATGGVQVCCISSSEVDIYDMLEIHTMLWWVSNDDTVAGGVAKCF